jgi:hypothetical protein
LKFPAQGFVGYFGVLCGGLDDQIVLELPQNLLAAGCKFHSLQEKAKDNLYAITLTKLNLSQTSSAAVVLESRSTQLTIIVIATTDLDWDCVPGPGAGID